MTDLDRLMAAVLVRLELASHTNAASSDSGKVSHGKRGGNQPPRISEAYHHFGHRYTGCHSDDQRKQVISAALDELRSLRYSKKQGHSGTKEGRRLIGLDPRPITVLMHVYGYSKSHIYRLRREARDRGSSRFAA
jgi:hypothetical protein